MASAVPLFNGFKHLPCPKESGGGDCTTSGCLFGHRADHQPSNTPPLRSLDGVVDDQDDATNGDSRSPPAKRQKTVSATASASKPAGPGPSEGEGAGEGRPLARTGLHSQPAGDGQPVAKTGLHSHPADRAKAAAIYDPLSPPSVGTFTNNQSSNLVAPSSLSDAPTPSSRAGDSQPSQPSLKPSTPHQPSASVASTPMSAPLSNKSNTFTPNTTSVREATPESLLRNPSTPSSSSRLPLASSSPLRRVASPLAQASATAEYATKTTRADTATSTSQPNAQQKPESLNPRLIRPAPAAHGVRHKLLTLLHVELTRLNTEVSNRSLKDPDLKALLLTSQELIVMALNTEQKIAQFQAAIYKSVMSKEVMKYKKMDFKIWSEERKQAREKKAPQKPSTLGAPVTISTNLAPAQEIEVLERIVTPITNLGRYGYVSAPPSDEVINKAKEAVAMSKGWEKCDRCQVRFQVFPDRNMETGELAGGGQCTYHPGKAYFPPRPKGDFSQQAKKYSCCNQDVGESVGCAQGQHHVWKTSDPYRLASLWNFVETPPNNSSDVKKAVAFDCEMCYSVYGLELVRVTATSWPDGAVLLDVLVQPKGVVLDLNTKYSGVFPEDLIRGVPWTRDWTPAPQEPGERKILQKVASPEAARELLFRFINPDTILLGHGLENDLNVMRIVHPKIVDTILLYPHKRGLPVRNSLKALMEQHLNRRIQIDNGEGHDSAEDARAAGDLARLKVSKEWLSMQLKGWKCVNGMLREPGWETQRTSLESAAERSSLDSAGVRTSEESVDSEEGGAPLLTEEILEGGS